MPVRILTPSAVGNNSDWTTVFGGSRPGIVQPPDDDDASYIETSTATRDGYLMTDLPSDALSVVTHTIKNRTKSTGPATGQINNYIFNSVDAPAVTVTTAYVTRSDVDLFTANPSVSFVNSSEIGVFATSMAGETLRCTSITWEVTYIAAPGGFASLVVGLLGPLVAVGLAEIPRLAAEIMRRSRGLSRVLPSEYVALYRELREGRYARHFLMKAA